MLNQVEKSAAPNETVMDSRASDGSPVSLRVSFPAPGIARLRIGSPDDVSPLPTLSLPEEPLAATRLSDNAVAGGGLTVTLDSEKFDFRVADDHGRVLLSTSTQDMTQKGAMRVEPVEVADTFTATSFRVEPDDHFLGYGEKFCNFDKRGLTITSSNSNAGGATSEAAYKNVPFFLNTRGYGVLFNTTRKLRHDVGEPRLSILSYRVEVDASELDFFVIDGPDPKTVLKRYAELTGFAPVPPLWTFGVWMSRFYFERWDTLLAAAEGYRSHDIPCDVAAPDSYWMYGNRLSDLQWDEDRFPDPAKHLAELRAKGFRTSLWLYPYISEKSPLFEEAHEKGYLCTSPDGAPAIVPTTLPQPCHDEPGFRGVGTLKHVFKHPIAPPGTLIDFTNPDAVAWYQGLLTDRLKEGVAVFKTDFGEDVPDDVQFHDERTGRDVHNIYPLLFQQAVAEATERFTGDFVIWGRSGWAGSQAYPIHWGGDPTTSWQAMSASLKAGLSYGLSGVPFWSHDIGGFAGAPPSAELYTRWAQFGLLSSHSRFHGTTPREPWEFGERATAIVRDFAKLRMRLLPYLHHLATIAHEEGLPVIRALHLEFPDDPGARLIDGQYMLGDALLVCPVFNAAGDVEYYLPRGSRWLDLRVGRWQDGGRWVSEKGLDLADMPLFLREGTMVPLVEPAACTDETDFSTLSLLVTPETSAALTFSLPDGAPVEVAFRRDESGWQARLAGAARIRLLIAGGPDRAAAILSEGDWQAVDARPEEFNLSAYALGKAGGSP
ncbi:hypothetical protein CH339_01430 [Rhodobium orientis]|uniref:Uncharacterized protein n=2 Tax=Rhodobium orientis TaxID=34017 RepID=A0A327JYY3_9HYPH|nr:hypothetical protein CH339_01430 [Rhodobium orientis]